MSPRLARYRLPPAAAWLLLMAPLTVAATVSTALRFRAPEAAIAIWPWNGEARGALASRKLVAGDIDGARALARRALRENPGFAPALRVAGIAEEARGEPARGARVMDLALKASRRDLLTNLWFVERNVARGDVDGAIRFYDYSLKSSAEAEQLLFPILVPAMANPDIAIAVRKKLSTRPVWTTSFLQYAFSSGAADAQLIPIALALSRDTNGLSLDLKRQYAQRLGERGNFEGLARWSRGLGYRLVDGPGPLDAVGNLPPVDWRLQSGDGLSAYAEPGGGFGFIASTDNTTIAQRVIHLPVGSYAIDFRVDLGAAGTDSRMRWTLACTSDDRPVAVTMSGPVARFDIPAGCAYQKLSLVLESERLSDGAEIQGSVSRIRLQRLR